MRRLLFPEERFHPAGGFQGIPPAAEGGETEIAFPTGAEAFPRRADDLDFIQQAIEEFPAAHSIRAFQPDVGSVFSAAVPEAETVEDVHQDFCIVFVVPYPHPVFMKGDEPDARCE